MRALLALAGVLVAASSGAQDAPLPGRPVLAEFRVFAGTEEITASTRLRLMPTGVRDQAVTVEGGARPAVTVPAGIYDVQALRLRNEGIVGIKWAERLVVMYYPDEEGRHLEVINFTSGYGALQLRAPRGIETYVVEVFAAGERERPAGTPVEGDGYRLFVLKAGQYDLRVRHAATPTESQDTHWFLDVEIPAERTRLKQLDIGQ